MEEISGSKGSWNIDILIGDYPSPGKLSSESGRITYSRRENGFKVQIILRELVHRKRYYLDARVENGSFTAHHVHWEESNWRDISKEAEIWKDKIDKDYF